jgi:hypothetical protein
MCSHTEKEISISEFGFHFALFPQTICRLLICIEKGRQIYRSVNYEAELNSSCAIEFLLQKVRLNRKENHQVCCEYPLLARALSFANSRPSS